MHRSPGGPGPVCASALNPPRTAAAPSSWVVSLGPGSRPGKALSWVVSATVSRVHVFAGICIVAALIHLKSSEHLRINLLIKRAQLHFCAAEFSHHKLFSKLESAPTNPWLIRSVIVSDSPRGQVDMASLTPGPPRHIVPKDARRLQQMEFKASAGNSRDGGDLTWHQLP